MEFVRDPMIKCVSERNFIVNPPGRNNQAFRIACESSTVVFRCVVMFNQKFAACAATCSRTSKHKHKLSGNQTVRKTTLEHFVIEVVCWGFFVVSFYFGFV